MVDIKNIKKIFNYCAKLYSKKDLVMFAEMQYELGLSYTETRELVDYFLSKNWFGEMAGMFRIKFGRIPPITPEHGVGDQLVQYVSARRINIKLLEELVRRGSMTYANINEFLEAKLKSLGSMHAHQLQTLNLGFIVDNVVYPTVDSAMVAYLKKEIGA